VDFLDQWRGEGSARAAYCNYPSEVCTAYPWPRPPSHTLPGSIVLARMASRATSMKLSAPTALLAENAPVPSRLSLPPPSSLLPSSPSRPSILLPACPPRVLNFSKIIAASPPLNRRDNRGIALRGSATRRDAPCRAAIDDSARARETQNEITFFRKSCLILGNYPAGEPPLHSPPLHPRE